MKNKLFLPLAMAALITLVGCPASEESFTDLTAGINDGTGTVVPADAVANIQTKYSAKVKELADAGTPITTIEDYYALTAKIANAELATVKTSDLTRDELVDLANLLNSAEKKELAMAICERLSGKTDTAAFKATQQIIDSLAQDKKYAELKTKITEYHNKFKPTADDLSRAWFAQYTLANHLVEKGESEKAYNLIMREINSLPKDMPYQSFKLLSYFANVFEDVGKADDRISLIEEIKSEFTRIVAIRNAEVPEDESEKKEHQNLTNQFKLRVKDFESILAQAKLIGQPAIDFNLSNFYNTEPTSLADLKGKVVMVDFWANWCGPCKGAFPKMRKLYDKHKDEGFVILGITSLQGYFSDNGIYERDITPEREYELTAEMAERLEMTWPLAFSDRSCKDPEYAVTGIPTFVVIDKAGIIRFIGSGNTPANHKKLEELVPELLAESE